MTPGPYRAPLDEPQEAAPGAGRVLASFAAWLGGSSLVTGALTAWQTARALSVFGMESHAPGLFLVSTLRSGAPAVAASAAVVAVVVATHRRAAEGPALRPSPRSWWIFWLVPPAFLVATSLRLAGAAVVFGTYGIGTREVLRSAAELAVPEDLLVGLASASLRALVLGGIAALALPRLAGVRAALAAKIAVAAVAAGMVGAVVGVAVEACVPDLAARFGVERMPPGLP